MLIEKVGFYLTKGKQLVYIYQIDTNAAGLLQCEEGVVAGCWKLDGSFDLYANKFFNNILRNVGGYPEDVVIQYLGGVDVFDYGRYLLKQFTKKGKL